MMPVVKILVFNVKYLKTEDYSLIRHIKIGPQLLELFNSISPGFSFEVQCIKNK